MKFFIVLGLCLFSFGFCFAQLDSISVTYKKVNSKILELKGRKIDTIISYHIDCIGRMFLFRPDSCAAQPVKYLLWRDHGQYFVERFDPCKDYNPILASAHLTLFLQNNFFKIEESKIQYPKLKHIIKGKVIYDYVFIDHSCHYIFEFDINNKLFTKNIDDFALETKYYERHLNVNYAKNQSSLLNKLKIMMEKEVADYNKNLSTKTGAQ